MPKLEDGMHDFVIYDKLGQVGGAAWVINANPTSKLQTELGVYHLQYDPDNLVPKAPQVPSAVAQSLPCSGS